MHAAVSQCADAICAAVLSGVVARRRLRLAAKLADIRASRSRRGTFLRAGLLWRIGRATVTGVTARARPAWVALWAGAKPVHSVSAALGRSPGPALRRRRRRRP